MGGRVSLLWRHYSTGLPVRGTGVSSLSQTRRWVVTRCADPLVASYALEGQTLLQSKGDGVTGDGVKLRKYMQKTNLWVLAHHPPDQMRGLG